MEKLRRNFKTFGYQALIGRKRGPKFWFRVHNRKPEWVEEKVSEVFLKHGGGPDTLLWIIEDYYHDQFARVRLSRSTVYRILIRRRLLFKKKAEKINPHPGKYTKGYPGEEIQVDTTEPFGKNKGILINFIDDYSRWAGSYFYPKNSSFNAKTALQHFLSSVPFPIQAVRVDNGAESKKHFLRFCLKEGINLIRNPVRTPEHNGKVERLHRTVEEECLWRIDQKQINNFSYVNYELAKYNIWYNTRRRHLGYQMDKQTPQSKIENWIINHKTLKEFSREVNETLILYMEFMRGEIYAILDQ